MNAQSDKVIAQFIGAHEGNTYVIRKSAVYRFNDSGPLTWFCSLERFRELGEQALKQTNTQPEKN
jgi:hypothetical protein